MENRRVDRTAEMETFLAVACAGSFSAAARELGLTPSAVSRLVTRIEQRLGVRLVVRTTRSLRLTREGDDYALAARRVLTELEQAESAIADRGSPRGLVRVSASLAHGRLSIMPLIPEFLARYPEITVDIHLSDEISDVEGGQIDVAIRFGPLPDSLLSARPLGETGRSIVAAPEYLQKHGYPGVPADLGRHNCLDFSFKRIEPGWPFKVHGKEIMLPVDGNAQANNGETLVQLALQGVGITRLGDFHIRPELESGRLVRVLEEFNPGDTEAINAVFIGGKTMPARVRVFIDYLVEKMQ
ncbi:LysR family transcriptional regulator [Marinobacter salinexigens]|uniref:LysR family transcriptional regulator n=1 Tax=Marinobacter salinexigens TaxID=2919747 RepID=A0A5B0VHV2_9GAMM|nr:LysR family transcriptional regulator [Marinobacter salinexigens]KAA1173988.1 LysR family transcriptional regulator [Marinobacter salinexigens]